MLQKYLLQNNNNSSSKWDSFKYWIIAVEFGISCLHLQENTVFWEEIPLQYKSRSPQQNRDHSTAISMLEYVQLGHKALNMLLSCGQRSPFWIESLVGIGINIALLWVFKISQWTLTIIQFAQQLLTDPYGVAESIFPSSIKRTYASCVISTHLPHFVSIWAQMSRSTHVAVVARSTEQINGSFFPTSAENQPDVSIEDKTMLAHTAGDYEVYQKYPATEFSYYPCSSASSQSTLT